MDALSLEDIAALAESVDTERKAARGREGRGELPSGELEGCRRDGS